MMNGPDILRVQTSDNVAITFPVAGLGTRLIAQIVDSCVIGLVLLIVAVLVSAFAATARDQQTATMVVEAGAASSVLLYLAYFTLSETAGSGRTLGKAAAHIRVIRIDGSAPGLPEILIRNLARLVDALLGIGIFFMFFHPLSRRLGDLAAGTIVVRDQAGSRLFKTVPGLIHLQLNPGPPIPGIERLGDQEYRVLRDFLLRSGLTPDRRSRLAADIAQRLAARMDLPMETIEQRSPPEVFLERICAQLAARRQARGEPG